MKSLCIVLLLGGMLGFTAYGFHRRHFSLRRDLPIYTCHWFTGEKAGCDLDSYTWEQQQSGKDEVMDSFRTCERLYIQGETESWAEFIKRAPHKQACWLMRKAVQPSGQLFPKDAYNLHVIGGRFGENSEAK